MLLSSRFAEAFFCLRYPLTLLSLCLQATFFAKQKEAEASYLAQKKESEGLLEMAKAYGALADVLGGPQGLMNYLMLQNNTYEKLAVQNAKAINGLQPKINVWNTGNQEGVDSTAPIRNLFQSLPPLLSTIQDQTGMQPPSWLAQMPQQQANGQHGQNGEMSAEEKTAKQKLLNGRK
jgi:flotillin